MRAGFIAVGSELLGTDRLDTNSLTITGLLRRYGVELFRKAVVGDNEEELAREVGQLAGRCELLLVTGGLGPTADDVTRQAVAAACGRRLVLDPAVVDSIAARFARSGRTMPGVNRRQAMVIEGAEVLANRAGTAPGQRLVFRGTDLFLLPGPPRELAALLADHLEPWLAQRCGEAVFEGRVIKVACVAESALEELIEPAYEELGRENVSVLADGGDIAVELRAVGGVGPGGRSLEAMVARLRELVGDAVYSEQNETLEEAVVALLAERGATVACGESCTGGLVAERLTRVAGASRCFPGAVVAYSNEVKQRLLGVPAEVIEAHGAVSRPVAEALAAGAQAALAADWGVGITGIAGPGGGSEEKPVGTVHLAVAGPGDELSALAVVVEGDRERIRRYSSQLALELLRRRILGLPTARLGVETGGTVA